MTRAFLLLAMSYSRVGPRRNRKNMFFPVEATVACTAHGTSIAKRLIKKPSARNAGKRPVITPCQRRVVSSCAAAAH